MQGDIEYSFYVTFPLCLIEKKVRRILISEKLVSTTCHVPSGTALILDQEGKVLPCCHMPNMSLGQFGVDFDSALNFSKFWSSCKMREFRKQCQMYPHIECSKCKDWRSCGGGCILNWTQWKPDEFIKKRR
ncbi:MAG: hypothetical protein C0412_15170 [Flavobacterium sp.]|nr:hypothetical protein [Flavobacterium sp.]